MSVAVVLRGHVRTWDFCKTSMFQVLESQYSNIDWYMVTWRESVTDQRVQSLHEDFQGRNFTLKVIEESSSEYDAWTSMGRCCMEVLDDIMEKQYTTVVETRPDMYLEMPPGVNFPEVEPGCFYTTGFVINWGEVVNVGSHDWFLIYDAQGFHTFAHERFTTIEPPVTGHLKVARKHDMALITLPLPFFAGMIRPSIWDVPDVHGWHGAVWMYQWDDAKKIQTMMEHGIALADYYTGGVAALNKTANYV